MTDLSDHSSMLPARLGVTARMDEGRFVLDLHPVDAVCRHGVVRASVLSYVVDAITGILVDGDPDSWTLTTDLSVRMMPVVAPERVTATVDILRQSKKSVSCRVDLVDESGALVGIGAAGFTKVPRRDSDPPKPQVSPEMAVGLFGRNGVVDVALREAAGIRTIHPGAGVVEMTVAPHVRNPNGTLQGAMVALLAEAAAEDLVESRAGAPVVVTDLDVRFLARATDGPVQSRCSVLGDDDPIVEVTLFDTSVDRITTLVHARCQKIVG